MTLLGAVVPQAVALSTKKLSDVGPKAGDVYAVSSVGSLFGAFLSGFVLIPFMGVSAILYMFSLILILLSIVRLDAKYLVVSAILIFPSISATPDLLYDVEGHYGRVRVGEQNGLRILVVDGSSQSCVRPSDMATCFVYQHIIKNARPQGDALIIGLGGGQLPKMMADADVVELDPVIVEAARLHFNYTGTPVIADGRSYIRNTDKTYSYIVLDAFKGYSLPGHLVTKEAFEEYRSKLTPGGGLAVNIVARPTDEVAGAIHSTLLSVFPHVKAKYVGPNLGNVIFFASDEPINGNFTEVASGVILTDDYNPIDYLSIPTNIEERSLYKKHIGDIAY